MAPTKVGGGGNRTREMRLLRALLGIALGRDESASAEEILKRTPLEELDTTVKALMRKRPAKEVRRAMIERISIAPLSEFDGLRPIFLKYFGDSTE